MELTLSRWTIGLALACGAIAVVASPISTSRPDVDEASPAYRTAMARAFALRRVVGRVISERRTASALARWRDLPPARDTMPLLVDPALPSAIRDLVADRMARQWSALGPSASGAHAAMFAVFDTTTIAVRSSRAAAVVPPADVVQILPEVTGDRCLTLVRVRTTDAAAVGSVLARDGDLAGVCGFYARFGLPGAPMRAWLDATAFAVGRSSAWSAPRPPAMPGSDLGLQLSREGGECLAHAGPACRVALGLAVPVAGRPSQPASGDAPTTPGILDPRAGVPPRFVMLGARHQEWLADLVRVFGGERFGRIWTSALPVPDAFAATTGLAVETYTQQWLRRDVGVPGEGPRVTVRLGVWLALVLPALLVAAVRPREALARRKS